MILSFLPDFIRIEKVKIIKVEKPFFKMAFWIT